MISLAIGGLILAVVVLALHAYFGWNITNILLFIIILVLLRKKES